MSLTIDEAIARFEANAEQNERWANAGLNPEANAEYAAEHRQLAEWLRELVERRKAPGDTISRQAAAELVMKYCPDDDGAVQCDGDIRGLLDELENLPSAQPVVTDTISKFIDGLEEIFADLREGHVDDSVCGLCEYDGAYIGQSGDWCNECPGFNRDDCFKLSDETRKKWTEEIINALPTIQPEPHEGIWVYGEDSTADCVDGYRCSQCGFFVPWDYNHKLIDYINDYAYCPHCGAKMTISK